MPELSNPDARMSMPGLDHWLTTPPGRYIIDWELSQVDQLVADVFGFNALQLGLPTCPFLRNNRIALRKILGPSGPVDLECSFTQLPIATQSVDLVVLPHGFEFAGDPHQVLREIERILIPEGQLILLGFNPMSLWGMRRLMAGRGSQRPPWQGHYLTPPRVRDWLKLLGFELERTRFGCYRPPCDQQAWLDRWSFMESAGHRWWPFSGSIYLIRAIKRVPGMRLITPQWRKKKVSGKALRPLTQKEGHVD